MKQFRDTPYLVSSTGKIYRKGKTKPLKNEMTNSGYYRVTLSIDGKVSRYSVHRLVAETYYGYPGKDYVVNHIDHDRTNNDWRNLEWVTQSENMKHCHKHNRCSNLIASNEARLVNDKRMEDKFSKLLGKNYISSEVVNNRRYVYFTCDKCLRVLRYRSDARIFNTYPYLCKECK